MLQLVSDGRLVVHHRWAYWWYIIGGRTGFWRSQNLMGPYASVHDNGGPLWDIYDGLMVPQATVWENRSIMAGWIGFDEGIGWRDTWGGHLVFRELKQRPDGNLEISRLAEFDPPLPCKQDGGCRIEIGNGVRYASLVLGRNIGRFACRIAPSGSGRFGVCLEETPGAPAIVELRFDAAARTAQWGTPAASGLAPVAEKLGWTGNDFAILGVEGLDRPFELDLVIFADTKSDTLILDAMINRRRTMITRRLGSGVQSLRFFAEGCRLEVNNLQY